MDAFEGTEVLASHQPGNSVSMVGEDFMFTQRKAGSTNIHQVTVVKCRQCGETLSQKDYHLTPQEKAQQIKMEEAAAKKTSFWWYLKWAFIVYIALGVLGSIIWLISSGRF